MSVTVGAPVGRSAFLGVDPTHRLMDDITGPQWAGFNRPRIRAERVENGWVITYSCGSTVEHSVCEIHDRDLAGSMQVLGRMMEDLFWKAEKHQRKKREAEGKLEKEADEAAKMADPNAGAGRPPDDEITKASKKMKAEMQAQPEGEGILFADESPNCTEVPPRTPDIPPGEVKP